MESGCGSGLKGGQDSLCFGIYCIYSLYRHHRSDDGVYQRRRRPHRFGKLL